MENQRCNDLPVPQDDHDRKLLADVEQHGWHVIGVEADSQGPNLAYSIGLFRTFGHPEILVFGLPVKVMHRIINAVGEQVRKGSRFEHLDEASEVLEGFSVCFRNVERMHYREFLGYARWYYQGNNFLVLQCVWPDKHNRYPWQAEFDQSLARHQPVLSGENSWPFQEGKNRAVFTTKPVVDEGHPILLVCHDADGDWQFLCGTTTCSDDALLVGLGEMLKRDPSVTQLADLPEGWQATRRDSKTAWRREKIGDPPE